MGHPMTNPELLDDGNQYLVIENHYKSESLGAYIGSTISRKHKVVKILNSLREVLEHKRKHRICPGVNYVKVGEPF
jgi:hypothetical protein